MTEIQSYLDQAQTGAEAAKAAELPQVQHQYRTAQKRCLALAQGPRAAATAWDQD